MDKLQEKQSEQYDFPYHYLAQLAADDSSFSGSRKWGFSLSYVTALYHISCVLSELGSQSHIDVGCGDGALIHFLSKRAPGIRLTGVDYDERAIAWARMFTPQAEFVAGNLHDLPIGHWQTASLIEVIEHIPLDQLSHFVRGVRRLLPLGANLILTVPHKNKPVASKHYQHFSFDSLAKTVGEHFEISKMFGFEFVPLGEKIFRKFLNRRSLYVESSVFNAWRLRYQIARKDVDEKRCGRIFAVLKPR